jgi:hypothetical protein
MGPIDYSIGVQSPFEGLQQGYAFGAKVLDDQRQNQMADLALKKAQEQMADQQRALDEFRGKNTHSSDDYLKVSMAVPGFSEMMQKGWDAKSKEMQQTDLRQMSEMFSQVQTPEGSKIVAQRLRDQADAERAKGDNAGYQAKIAMSKVADELPDVFGRQIGISLASIPGGLEVLKAYDTQMKRDAEIAQTQSVTAKNMADAGSVATKLALDERKVSADEAKVANDSAASAATLGFKKDELASNIQMKLTEMRATTSKMEPDARKIVNESVASSIKARAQVENFNDLANRVLTEGKNAGAAGGMLEWFKRAAGVENATTALRNELVQASTKGVMASLPPGSASDADVKFAREPVPKGSSSPELWASYLRGVAKIKAFESAFDEAQARWVGQVGSMDNAKQDIEMLGVKVPSGSSFIDFSKRYLKRNQDSILQQAAPPRAYEAYGGATGGY